MVNDDLSEAYSHPAEEVAKALGTDLHRGLTQEDAAARLSKYGRNELTAEAAVPAWRRWVLGGAAILTVLAAVVNGGRFAEAAGLLQHRYDGARAYAEALNARTGPDDLIVLGLQPAAALGWVAKRVRKPVTLDRIPRFDSLRVVRKGWPLFYEHWSPEALDSLRRAGARFFASEYGYGIRTDTAVQRYLDANGRLLGRTPDWVIYALQPAVDTAQ